VATVVLPRSLLALFPGLERHVEVEGNDVAEVVAALDERSPGLRDRLVDAGPRIREHINVFVDGESATLATPVSSTSTVHVIPAVSGGQPTR
jgi:molybdopterin converting factor small subunit